MSESGDNKLAFWSKADHLWMCVFKSRDKDGSRHSITRNPMLHAKSTALFSVELELLLIELMHCISFHCVEFLADWNRDLVLTWWPSYTNFTHIPRRYPTDQRYCIYIHVHRNRQTYIQTYIQTVATETLWCCFPGGYFLPSVPLSSATSLISTSLCLFPLCCEVMRSGGNISPRCQHIPHILPHDIEPFCKHIKFIRDRPSRILTKSAVVYSG